MNDSATSLETDDLRNFREAKDRARALRDEAITRERARFQSVCRDLEITVEELVGLPIKKRGRKPKQLDATPDQADTA